MSSCSKGSNACGDVALLSRLCYRNEASCPKLSVSVHIIYTCYAATNYVINTSLYLLCVQGSRSKEMRRNQYDFKFWASIHFMFIERIRGTNNGHDVHPPQEGGRISNILVPPCSLRHYRPTISTVPCYYHNPCDVTSFFLTKASQNKYRASHTE